MQKIMVADVSVKEGTNKRGTYVQTTVTSDDGTKFSSFADSATSIEVGDLIEIEVVVKGNYNNFTEVKTLEKGTGQPKSSNGQDIKGASIEAQNAYSGVIQLIIHDKIKPDGSLALTALAYAASKLSQWGQSSKPITSTEEPSGDKEGKEVPEFENVGSLLNWCSAIGAEKYPNGINRKKFMEILGITDTANINISDAYQVIKEHLERS